MKLSPADLMTISTHSSGGQRKICAVTCYDYQTACWLNETPIDFLLVGDSVAEIIYGETVQQATVGQIASHVKAVRKGAPNKHIMADMPINSYENQHDALTHGKQLISVGADSLKLENPKSDVVKALIEENIALCGHIGLQPQTDMERKKKGTTESEASALLESAGRLEKLGCFSLLLEAVSSPIAKQISVKVAIPTIGIASGDNSCDGKILVIHDLLGLTHSPPPFAKKLRMADFGQQMVDCIEKYCQQDP